MRTKLTLTFEVESEKALSREYVRKVTKYLRAHCECQPIIDAFYDADNTTDIWYVALETEDRWSLRKAGK